MTAGNQRAKKLTNDKWVESPSKGSLQSSKHTELFQTDNDVATRWGRGWADGCCWWWRHRRQLRPATGNWRADWLPANMCFSMFNLVLLVFLIGVYSIKCSTKADKQATQWQRTTFDKRIFNICITKPNRNSQIHTYSKHVQQHIHTCIYICVLKYIQHCLHHKSGWVFSLLANTSTWIQFLLLWISRDLFFVWFCFRALVYCVFVQNRK